MTSPVPHIFYTVVVVAPPDKVMDAGWYLENL